MKLPTITEPVSLKSKGTGKLIVIQYYFLTRITFPLLLPYPPQSVPPSIHHLRKCDRYKKEALHLDDVLEKKKTEIKSLLKNLETLSQDKVCLKAEINKLACKNTALENKFKELGVNDVVSADEKDDIVQSAVLKISR